MEGWPKAEDVCKIISACRRAGVVTFKCGTIEISFGEVAPSSPQGVAPTPAAEDPEKTIQAQETIEASSIEEQGIQTREDQIAELTITDPLLAEELMESDELQVTGESTDGTSGEALD